MKSNIINQNDYDYLSKENTLWIRGMLAVAIFICHIPNYIGLFSGSVLGSVLSSFGAPCVAIFFFLSGFGLTQSYINRGGGYIFSLPKKRILPLYLKCLFLIAVYIGLLLALGNKFDLVLFIKSFFIGDTYVLNGWYLQTLVLLYLLFFGVFALPVRDNKKIILILSLTLVYYGIFYYLGIQSNQHYWFSSVMLFPIGIIYALKRKWVDEVLNRKKIITLLIGFSLILLGGVILIFRRKIELPVYLSGLQSTFISISIALGTLLILRFVNLNFGFTRFLGKVSLEIYVLQGAAFIIAKSSWLSISNLYLQLLVSILITAILCVPFHYLFKCIDSIFNKTKVVNAN